MYVCVCVCVSVCVRYISCHQRTWQSDFLGKSTNRVMYIYMESRLGLGGSFVNNLITELCVCVCVCVWGVQQAPVSKLLWCIHKSDSNYLLFRNDPRVTNHAWFICGFPSWKEGSTQQFPPRPLGVTLTLLSELEAEAQPQPEAEY